MRRLSCFDRQNIWSTIPVSTAIIKFPFKPKANFFSRLYFFISQRIQLRDESAIIGYTF